MGQLTTKSSRSAPPSSAVQVLTHKSYDGFKSDLWSCGCVLFVMLSGRLAFNQKTLPELVGKIKVPSPGEDGGTVERANAKGIANAVVAERRLRHAPRDPGGGGGPHSEAAGDRPRRTVCILPKAFVPPLLWIRPGTPLRTSSGTRGSPMTDGIRICCRCTSPPNPPSS